MSDAERKAFLSVNREMPDPDAQTAVQELAGHLFRRYGVKPVILLDEYDTPLHEAWLNGYWDEIVGFMRGFFNRRWNCFLTNAMLNPAARINPKEFSNRMYS